MNWRSSTFLFLTVFFAFSCHNKAGSEANKSAPKNPPQYTELVKDLKVTCKDQSNCSPSVGNFVVYDIQKTKDQKYMINFGNCTASLIAPDTVITNRHCFIDDNAKAGDPCQNILVKFPQVREFPEEAIQCKEILFRPLLQTKTEKEVLQNLDVAIVKLAKSSNRPVLKTSTEGFKADEVVTIHRVTTKDSDSTLDVLHCPVIQDGAIQIQLLAAKAFSAFVYLGDCPIIESNSGSPILNGQGHLKGVINLFISSEKTKEQVPSAKDILDGAGGINLACVNHPSVNEKYIEREECQQSLDPKMQDKLSEQRLYELKANRLELIKKDFSDFYSQSQAQYSLLYGEVKTEGFNPFDFLTGIKKSWFYPSCAQSSDSLLKFYQSQKTLPILQEQTSFDKYGRLVENIKVQILEVKEVKVTQEKNQLKLMVSGVLNQKSFSAEQDIPLCAR